MGGVVKQPGWAGTDKTAEEGTTLHIRLHINFHIYTIPPCVFDYEMKRRENGDERIARSE